MAEWRRYRRGRAEIQAGVVLLVLGILGGLGLLWWEGGFAAAPTGTVFTTHSYVSGVAAIMFVGMTALGSLLLVTGLALRVIQRMTGRD